MPIWMMRSGLRPPFEAANSSSIKGRTSRTVAYATEIGVGCTWRETRREPALSGVGNRKDDGREDAMRYEAFTRLVLNGYVEIPR